jgi:DNA-binding NarL/FixJ family response regulator
MLEDHSDLAIVAEAANGPAAVELARTHHPDVAVMDIGMKEMNGIEATARLLRDSPRTAVLILTVYESEHYVVRAVEAGARGYLTKDYLDEERLLEAIHTLSAGGRFFGPEVARFVSSRFPAAGQAG